MIDEDLDARLFFTLRCLSCRRRLQFLAENKDDLLERIAASRWELQPSAAMADPTDDGEEFLCADCAPTR